MPTPPDSHHEKHETHEIPSRGAEVRRNKAAHLEWARGGAQPEVYPQMAQIYADFGKEFPDLRGTSNCVAGRFSKRCILFEVNGLGRPFRAFVFLAGLPRPLAWAGIRPHPWCSVEQSQRPGLFQSQRPSPLLLIGSTGPTPPFVRGPTARPHPSLWHRQEKVSVLTIDS